jgi:geranylgeranyl diphosphate synthase type II
VSLLSEWREAIGRELDRLVPKPERWPSTLHRAIRHSLFAGGKRLRPLLALAAARACGGDEGAVLPAACGLEMIHTYSLIHDDLPALDDDDWRRGVLTCHREFGEATAILAGDALLTLGLGCLARYPEDPRFGPARLAILSDVVDSIGSQGMIGGQVEDLAAEEEKDPAAQTPERLERIHSHKTGKLIAVCLRTGGRLAFAPPETIERLSRLGELIGLAFQIKDDLLDVESSREELGKATGKDSARGKLTFPGVHGLERSREILETTAEEAVSVARELEGGDGPLPELASFVERRRN